MRSAANTTIQISVWRVDNVRIAQRQWRRKEARGRGLFWVYQADTPPRLNAGSRGETPGEQAGAEVISLAVFTLFDFLQVA